MTQGGTTNILLKTLRKFRHGLKVSLNYRRNSAVAGSLRRRILRESPGRRIVAVMLLEHLGDIVACEPVVRFLREKDPDVFLIWGVKKGYLELIESNPHIDAPLTVHCLTERLLLERSGLFDEIFDLHFPDRYCSLCRNPLRKDPGTSGVNLMNYFSHGSLLEAMAKSAGLPPLDGSPQVYISEKAVRKVDALGLPPDYIAVSCTSNTEEKSWPREKWHELMNMMSESTGIPVVEIGLSPFLTGFPGVTDLCGKLSILESAEVIRRAKLFIGIDSGPAHLANAVGTRGIVMLGSFLGFSTYMPFSGFYGKGGGAEIVRADGAAARIPVERVYNAVGKMMATRGAVS